MIFPLKFEMGELDYWMNSISSQERNLSFVSVRTPHLLLYCGSRPTSAPNITVWVEKFVILLMKIMNGIQKHISYYKRIQILLLLPLSILYWRLSDFTWYPSKMLEMQLYVMSSLSLQFHHKLYRQWLLSRLWSD